MNSGAATPSGPRAEILVLDDDPMSASVIGSILARNGYGVSYGRGEHPPDLIIASSSEASLAALERLSFDVAAESSRRAPVVFLEPVAENDPAAPAPRLKAEDTLAKPVRPPELVARVRAVLARHVGAVEKHLDRRRTERTVGLSHLIAETRRTRSRRALLNESSFAVECAFDIGRATRDRSSLSIACLDLFEFAGIRVSHGARGESAIAAGILAIAERFPAITRIGSDPHGRFFLLVKQSSSEARDTLTALARAIVAHRFHVDADPIRITPTIGFASRSRTHTFEELKRRACLAGAEASLQHDLVAVPFAPRMDTAPVAARADSAIARVRASLAPSIVPLQLAATVAASLALPFVLYVMLARQGIDVTGAIYDICVLVLASTALGIVWESLLAIPDRVPPRAAEYPAATAIIAAYLPNEAATILETVEAFLRLDYPAGIQIILAYNTPRALPMEEELRAIAERDPRLELLRVMDSTSKAQNVNAALRYVRGSFVGIFDADHTPETTSFTRAWDWLASGYDVVQGHCLIRNGSDSLVSRLVAVEFESIYAVSHPGRSRLHGFGLFGGSNGYWKTDLLRQTRMHRFMLTEDIDSSLRLIRAGYRIATDRGLISRELAPIGFAAFWNQRLRWAQGWFQVTLRHLGPALRSPHLTLRQKVGVVHLLLWREWYVWISLQILPILAFWIFVRHDRVEWLIPLFLAATIFIALAGPIQLAVTYALAHRSIRAHRSWFALNLVATFVFFGELKNAISRLAHIKELMRERAWHITPRTSPPPKR